MRCPITANSWFLPADLDGDEDLRPLASFLPG